jgi:hypothetical protein
LPVAAARTDHRGQTQAHLVEHEQLRPAAEGPRERQHLLFAAGQQAGLAPAQLAQRREVVERGIHLGLADHAVQPEVLGHRQAEEDSAVVRDVRQAESRPRGRGDAREILAAQADRAAGGLQQPGNRPQRGGLAGAVGAEKRHDLATAHGQRQVAHDRRTVIGDAQPVEFENGIASGCHPPPHLRRPPSARAYLAQSPPASTTAAFPGIGVHANLPGADMCPPHT